MNEPIKRLRTSKIFTEAEIKLIKRREQGDLSDPTGLFAGRIKPKLIELLTVWLPQKRKMNKLIKIKK